MKTQTRVSLKVLNEYIFKENTLPMGEDVLKLARVIMFSAGSMASVDFGRFHWECQLPS